MARMQTPPEFSASVPVFSSPLSSSTRRVFLKSSLSAATAVSGFSLSAGAPAVFGQDKSGRRRSVALIGSGWWGMNILNAARETGTARVVALCDADRRALGPAQEKIAKEDGDRPNLYQDYRELLEKEKPEIVIVATPDHWHALIAIDAMKAGAHVYVEKPVSHTVLEGLAMTRTARETERVCQVGLHRRVSPHNVSGREFLRSGKAGKIGMARAFVFYGGGPERPVPNQEPPPELDWNLWCGPAPLRHFCQNYPSPWGGAIHPRGFRNYLDYANGTLGDWGIHWLDQIRWCLEPGHPISVHSTGGRPVRGPAVYNEKEQTSDAPDHQVATYQFENLTVVWEHRNFAANNAEKTHPQQSVGVYFYGTEGTFHMGWLDGWTFYPADPRKPVIHEPAKLNEPDQQNIRELWMDFIGAIEEKRKPAADIEEGHLSTTLSLLGMLSLKLGRSVRWDGQAHRIPDDPEANRLLRRDYRGEWKYPGEA